MNYEKKYKEAFERAKGFYIAPNQDPAIITRLEHIFPELEESDDERIRKEIKQHFLFLDDSDPHKEEWLTWLEKQKIV